MEGKVRVTITLEMDASDLRGEDLEYIRNVVDERFHDFVRDGDFAYQLFGGVFQNDTDAEFTLNEEDLIDLAS